MSEPTWTIKDVLLWTQESFTKRGIDSARLDAELLLAHVLGKDRVYLYTHYDQPLTPPERETYRTLVQRRQKREPVAYILGEREFYGRAFTVNNHVLVPRPETEHLIDAVREWVDAQSLVTPRILDVGTGSGAIAVTLAAQYPQATVVGIDVSAAALAVTRTNAARHGVTLELHEGDLLAPVAGATFDVIAANLPYVPERDRPTLAPELEHEPALALYGGELGLTVVERLIRTAAAHLANPGLLALEIGAGQWPRVLELLRAATGLTDARVLKDLGGHERVAIVVRRPD